MQPKGLCPRCDRTRHVAERNEAQGQSHQARDLRQHRPALGPASLAHQSVLHDEPPEAREDQRHRVIGDLVDEGVGAIGDRDALLRRRLDIDRVDADAAERDDLAAIETVDHPLGDPPPLGVERVGVARGRDELVLGPRADLEDLGVDRRQRLHLVPVIAGGREAGAGRRRDPELGQNSLRCAKTMLPGITTSPEKVVNRPAPVRAPYAGSGTARAP